MVSKVEPLKPISCGHCGKPGHIITNCWKLGGKTPCEHCGKFNHKSEDCRIVKNKLQKEVKHTGFTSLKGLKVSPFNESENSKDVKVKPLIDQNKFVEKNKGIKVNPLHNVKSCLEDKISMRPSLPVEGISLILGNDLAGERVMVDPRVVEKPRDDEKTERLAEKFPGIFPASVVTRSMLEVQC